MSVRKLALIVVLSLLSVGTVAGWWYAGEVQETRQARQGAALEAGIEALEGMRYDTAVSAFRSVPSSHPDGWRARYLEGSTQILLKQYGLAIPLLEEALALNPTHTRTLHALGVAHFKLGNLAVSKAYFAHVLEIDPGDEEARGLMEIMARLERQPAPGAAAEEPSGD